MLRRTIPRIQGRVVLYLFGDRTSVWFSLTPKKGDPQNKMGHETLQAFQPSRILLLSSPQFLLGLWGIQPWFNPFLCFVLPLFVAPNSSKWGSLVRLRSSRLGCSLGLPFLVPPARCPFYQLFLVGRFGSPTKIDDSEKSWYQLILTSNYWRI